MSPHCTVNRSSGSCIERAERGPDRVRVLMRDVVRQLARSGSGLREAGPSLHAGRWRSVGSRCAGVTTLSARANAASGSPYVRSSRKNDVRADVVEQRWQRRVERVRDSRDRLERLDLDLDELARVLGDGAALGHDHRDRLTGEAHLAVRERRVRRRGQPFGPDRPEPLGATRRPGVLAGQVRRGQDQRDAGDRARGGGVDAHEPPVWHGAADERRVQRARR